MFLDHCYLFDRMIRSADYFADYLKETNDDEDLLNQVEFIRLACETPSWHEWEHQDDPNSWPTRSLRRNILAFLSHTFCNLPSNILGPLFGSKFMYFLSNSVVRKTIRNFALQQLSERDLCIGAWLFQFYKWPRKRGAVPNELVERLLRGRLVDSRGIGLTLLPYARFSIRKQLEEMIIAGKSKSLFLQVKFQNRLSGLAYSYRSSQKTPGPKNLFLWRIARNRISQIIGNKKIDRQYWKQFRYCLRVVDELLCK